VDPLGLDSCYAVGGRIECVTGQRPPPEDGIPVDGPLSPVGAAATAAKAASKVVAKVVRTTRAGDKGVRITRPDGSIIDITPQRVKEYVPNTNPNAPPGTMDRVKFSDALPGSKGYKRAPTAHDLGELE
jgi:hypothetical protein